ncbi:hypothetical protein ACFC1R_15330 [Kitasatospora sp. NPDC056138]|uniref:hypothetical protein n=1 Tax=Kitasatospora sp. NPDC056138 TaxID=3345724 RepID=UPI0035DD79A9
MNVRQDSELAGLDVPAAITRGLMLDGGPRRALFTEAAIAACRQAEQAGIGPYPLGFLAQHVRVGGIAAALELPEPVIGQEGADLVRRWLRAAAMSAAEVEEERLFARWLGQVATLMSVRRRAYA